MQLRAIAEGRIAIVKEAVARLYQRKVEWAREEGDEDARREQLSRGTGPFPTRRRYAKQTARSNLHIVSLVTMLGKLLWRADCPVV